MTTVAVIGYTCPACNEDYTHFVEAVADTAFLIPEAWCATCTGPYVKMNKTVKKIVTSGQLASAKQEALRNANESIEAYLP